MIDPASASAAFATVVGLIGQFKSSKDGAKSQDFNEFMTFLIENGHSEIRSLIEASHTTTIGIKAVLGQHASQVNEALLKIDTALAAFASTLDGFADIGSGLRPETVLSSQALDILRQFENAKASTALERKHRGHTLLYMLDGNSGYIAADEVQFLEDDLMRLTELGLLRPDSNQSGERLFRYTRAASSLVKASQNQNV
jgi:hypothetical protein